MKRFRFVLFLLTALVLPACQLFGSLPAAEDGSTVNTTRQAQNDVFAENTNPVNVSVTLNEARAAEALIPIAGGSLSVTGADGTIFTLTIPPDALLADTTIRMLPVATMDGLPFGSQPLAVQLYPEGLFFNNYVTLAITPAVTIPIDQQITFGYLGSGQDVILAPPVVNSSEIQIQLLHFSGYGVTKGVLADVEPLRQRIGGDAERRLQNLAAQYLSTERQRQLLGGEPDGEFAAFFEELSKQYEEQVIQPRVAAAGQSCAAGQLAWQTVLGYERQRQLLGMPGESLMARYSELMNTVTSVCLKEEYELCVNDHIIHRVIPVWLGFERQYQLLGVENTAALPLFQQAKDMVTRCLNFELVFESTGNFDDGSGGLMTSIVKAKVPLRFDFSRLNIQGESALYNESYQYSVPGCSVTPVRGGGTFSVGSLAYEVEYASPEDQLGRVTDLLMGYYPGLTSESYTIQCEDSPSYTMPPYGFWTGVYLVLHENELDMSASDPSAQPGGMDLSSMMTGGMFGAGTGGLFAASDWEILGAEYFAKKEWIKTDNEGLGLTEAGTFKLYHRPAR